MTENKNTDELMQVGRTAGAYGVRGWVRVVPMGRQGDLLFESDRWWFLPYPRKPGVSPKLLTVSELKAHGKDFIAKIEEIHTREEAMALKGSLLVDRNDLPQLQEGDYYDEDKKNTSEVLYYYCPSWKIDEIDEWRAALPSHANAVVVEMLPLGNSINNEQTSYQSKMATDLCGVAPFRKFDDIDNGKRYFETTSSMRDIYLARLAETNLIAAEACIQLNKPEEAVTYVNIVRNRAKATPATADEMSIDYILNERARELAGEYLRWPDLVRTGKLVEYVEAHNPDIPAGRITSKFYLRPIPLSAIELNPALAGHQNEGW